MLFMKTSIRSIRGIIMAKTKRSEFIGLRVTTDIKQKLEKIAEKEDRSIAYVVNLIIVQYFEKSEKTK